jgi:hypothetical protein
MEDQKNTHVGRLFHNRVNHVCEFVRREQFLDVPPGSLEYSSEDFLQGSGCGGHLMQIIGVSGGLEEN